MSPGDDDIAAALPRPPLPAPARREAAIAAALRRFDGVGEAEPTTRRPPPAASWARRPSMGALAAAALVAVIALPLAWTSLDDQPYREARKPPPARAAPDPAPPAGEAVVAPAPSSRPPPSSRAPSAAAPPPSVSTDAAKAVSQPAPVMAPPAPAAEPVARQAAEAPDEAGGDQIVVTGSRIRHPNLESSVPVTVVGDSAVGVTGSRAAGRSARRGDWNSCTVEDPGRSLGGCRVSAEMADGLARAWKGDWEGAARAFDAAVAAAPRSSSAHLNRGLVRRRTGELERALADLDRAVRFSPRAARYYYHRSLVLRELGDSARAQTDEVRAVELDPRYADVVRRP